MPRPRIGSVSWATSSAPPTSASTPCPATTSSRTGTTPTGCGCTTSTRARRPGRLLPRRADLGLPLSQDAAGAHEPPACGSSARTCGLRALRQADRPPLVHVRPARRVRGRLLAALDLRDAIVVQDWGGPIGLRWAVENADRVARLVILNTGLFTGRVSKGFMAWRDFAERNPDLPVGFVLQGATATELERCRRRLRGALPDARVEGGARPSSRCSCRSRTTSRARPRCARWRTSCRAGRSPRSSRSRTRIRCSPTRARGSASRR